MQLSMQQYFGSEEILKSELVKKTIQRLFDDEKTEVLSRPASFVIKLKSEPQDKVRRIILLPPHGFTANKIDETNSHPEARRASITIKGGVRIGRTGFNLLKKAIKFAYFTKRDIVTKADEPYAKTCLQSKFYKEKIKSARERFFVVKENGEGFYHNLINISNEWALLVLEKELKLQRKTNFDSKIANLEKEKRETLKELFYAIENKGDAVFEENKELVKKATAFEANDIMLPLIEALNILESGKHEPCTVYALILKIGRKNPNMAIEYLDEAIKNKEAPKYYLEELIKKLSKVKK